VSMTGKKERTHSEPNDRDADDKKESILWNSISAKTFSDKFIAS
jgi:hypothetical protein